jgi:hypothetical protein
VKNERENLSVGKPIQTPSMNGGIIRRNGFAGKIVLEDLEDY